jgi:1-acyl-sn-glycerol-3-phosphate acyltransferase
VTLSQKIAVTIIKPLYHIFFSWEAKGRENMPPSGPLIVVANHVHVIDAELLLFGISRWITFIAKERLFHYPILGALLRWAQTLMVPSQRTLTDIKELLQQVEQTLNKGSVIGIFPEGKRSHQGKLQEGKPGLAVLASRMHIPILPVGISGTDKIHGTSWFWKRPHIIINIGKPLYLPQPNGRLTKLQRKALTDLMMHEIAALLPPEYQGVYSKYGD